MPFLMAEGRSTTYQVEPIGHLNAEYDNLADLTPAKMPPISVARSRNLREGAPIHVNLNPNPAIISETSQSL